MSETLEILDIEQLRPLLDRRKVLDCVRQALIWQAEGKVQSPLPGHLLFREPPGDCHIKFGHVEDSDSFAIKVATGFYENPQRGLPVNFGLILVFDAQTGAPRALLKDDGWLTAWRTAAATAIAAQAMAPETITEIGIVGTGLQASLAIEWLPETLGPQRFAVWGRNPEKAEKLASTGGHIRPVADIKDLLHDCNVIVTATPAESPLFCAQLVKPGTHIVGIGTDTPGKQELPAELFARAAHILTDDHAQSVDHGDFGNAVRAGIVPEDSDVMLGSVLSGRTVRRRQAADITIADLTGIAAEDIAISRLFCELHRLAAPFTA